MLWRATADIVVAVHAAYVAIVVVGFAAILLGSAAQWRAGCGTATSVPPTWR